MKMKKLILIAGVWFALLQIAGAQHYTSKSYSTGNYIFCGRELAKNFSWLIEKQDARGKWISVAELQAPKNAAECRSRMMSLPAVVASVTGIDEGMNEFIWEKIKNPSATLDSLYIHSDDPRWQYIAGAGWFDDGIKAPGTYKYRISRLSGTRSKTEAREVSVTFPPEASSAEAVPLRYKVNMGYIEISYELSDMQNTMGIKLQRSPYMKNLFSEVAAETMFAEEKGKMVALIRDRDVTSGIIYSYIAVPYDGLGNMGKPSETVNVNFVTKPADIGIVTELTVTPQPDKGGNLLKWDYDHTSFVNAIEIYRSTSYNDNYKRVVSLPADQREYFDGSDLQPSITYYYYAVLNNGTGISLPSARVPAILRGNRENIIPPQDLTASRNSNVVTLQFRRVGYDIHGYYVYRADGYTSELRQLPLMLHSTDSLLTYTDTLPVSSRSAVYSYAVASVNTSYNISPMSNRVSISFSGGLMPVPDRLNALLEDNAVKLVWSDVAALNPSITAYEVFRIISGEGAEAGPGQLLGTVNFMTNSYTDKQVLPGRNYVYRVRCIASDATDVSSFSLPYSVIVPAAGALPPGEVSAIASTKYITLKWTLPVAEDIQSVLVYRAPENGRESLLKTLDGKAETFTDNSAERGKMYYYFIVIKYKNGLESRPNESVSARIDQ
jgi:fibronectin type 3 domain-containing protein